MIGGDIFSPLIFSSHEAKKKFSKATNNYDETLHKMYFSSLALHVSGNLSNLFNFIISIETRKRYLQCL